MIGSVVLEQNLPQHIAIVMDGNGRWAESKGLPRIEGHRAGVATVKKIITSCLEKKIACLSLFAFSSENWSRPDEEVSFLMALFLESLKNEITELNFHGIKIVFTGDKSRLTASLQQKMSEAVDLTQHNQQLILNLVVNYGGKWDIVTAAKKMAAAARNNTLDLETVNESDFAKFLDTGFLKDPDLFIRTSGELRISNFFLWQLAYTELYFTEVHWPDFNEIEFEKALLSFANRQRRFGLVSRQC